ncbi:arylsulfotransferase family protein [Salinicola lusitanus]|uniref:Arylsulfotransferase family protein n=1 Tax=Salinicola lusitanus TaxID=1949085 RepID=A0ABZ3CXW7_9GAMM
MHNADRAGFAIFCVAIAFMAFIGGAFVILTKSFPYTYLDDAHKAAVAVIAQQSDDDLYTGTDLWRDARRDDRGTTIDDPEKAYEGLTLYTSGDGPYANLVDMHGKVVHRWELPYSDVWETSPTGRDPRPDDRMYWRKAKVLPNGDLVAMYIADNDTPWGYGIVKLDADSRVIWKYHASTHHDLDITPDGDVITLTHAFTQRKVPDFQALSYPWLDDYLVRLDGETGEEISKVSLGDAFIDSPFAALFYSVPSFATEDPLHTNSVQYLDDELTRNFAPANGHGGQIMLSFRHPGAVALVDPDAGEMTWAMKGPWLGQHSARVQPNGNFTLFDNLGNFERGNRTRILEVNPNDDAIVASYSGTDEHPFDSGLRGAAQTLPNGNRLITESDGGRLFETTPQGEIAWEFINPARGGDKEQYVPVVSSGQRIATANLDADFRADLDTTRR